MDKEHFCEVYQERSSIILYILGCLIFIGVAFMYINYAQAFSDECSMREFRQCCFANPVFYFVLGKGLLSYFGLCIIVFVYLLIRPYRLFYMNKKGFWSMEYGLIEWDNIYDLHMSNIALQTAICFNVKDKKRLKIPFYYVIFQKINKIMNGREFYIGFSAPYNKIYEIFKIMKTNV